MKRILSCLLLICFLTLASMLLGCAVGTDGADNGDSTAVLLGTELVAAAGNVAHLNTDVSTELVYTFRIPANGYDSLVSEAGEPPRLIAYTGKVTDGAKITAENGAFSAVSALGRHTYNGTEYYCFDVSVGSVFAQDYLTAYGATLTVSYKVGAEERSVSFDAAARTVYDVAFSEYTDRAASESEKYPYSQEDGSYSPYASLERHRSILAAALVIYLTDSGVRYSYSSEHYTSPYVCDYFDGVLTVRALSADGINPSIFNYLVVNGHREYFEIHDGIIRIVV